MRLSQSTRQSGLRGTLNGRTSHRDRRPLQESLVDISPSFFNVPSPLIPSEPRGTGNNSILCRNGLHIRSQRPYTLSVDSMDHGLSVHIWPSCGRRDCLSGPSLSHISTCPRPFHHMKDASYLYSRASHIRIRVSNVICSSRVLYYDRVRCSRRHSVPIDLKVSGVVCPTQ